ncbi:MAG TPA: hypothetical protein VN455_11720, partial [Methanotrichaceae archaeon]|nr:hypothetical protein [Methanotrichaceae archaeon]
GICVSTCPKGARRLKARKNYLNRYYPIDFVNRFKERSIQERIAASAWGKESRQSINQTSPDAQR